MCFSVVVDSVEAKVLLYPRVTSVLVSEPPSGEAVVKLVWYVVVAPAGVLEFDE